MIYQRKKRRINHFYQYIFTSFPSHNETIFKIHRNQQMKYFWKYWPIMNDITQGFAQLNIIFRPS